MNKTSSLPTANKPQRKRKRRNKSSRPGRLQENNDRRSEKASSTSSPLAVETADQSRELNVRTRAYSENVLPSPIKHITSSVKRQNLLMKVRKLLWILPFPSTFLSVILHNARENILMETRLKSEHLSSCLVSIWTYFLNSYPAMKGAIKKVFQTSTLQ